MSTSGRPLLCVVRAGETRARVYDLTSGELEDWITAEDGDTFFKIVLVPVSNVSLSYISWHLRPEFPMVLSNWGEGAVVVPRVVSCYSFPMNTKHFHFMYGGFLLSVSIQIKSQVSYRDCKKHRVRIISFVSLETCVLGWGGIQGQVEGSG